MELIISIDSVLSISRSRLPMQYLMGSPIVKTEPIGSGGFPSGRKYRARFAAPNSSGVVRVSAGHVAGRLRIASMSCSQKWGLSLSKLCSFGLCGQGGRVE